MRNVMFYGAALLVLNGCLLGKMEDGMDQTNAKITDSNRLIGETKDGQQLGLALELMTKPDLGEHAEVSTNVRTAATETVFTRAPEDRIGKYIGLPGHIKMLEVGERKLPNVAVIGEGIDETLGVSMVNRDLYRIQSFTALSVLEQLAFKASMPGLTAEDMTDLRTKTLRMIPVATAVLGAAEVTDIKAHLMGRRARPFEVTLVKRQRASQLIGDLVRMLSLSDDDARYAKLCIETRLGVGVY